jgi:hypothetical protein
VRGRVANLVVAFLLVFSIGGHWALLQSVAWMGMLVSYSSAESFKSAVEKTFDGRHPCKLCKTVEQGKKCEKKQQLQKFDLKITWILSPSGEAVWSPADFQITGLANQFASLLFSAPPSPPPRLA